MQIAVFAFLSSKDEIHCHPAATLLRAKGVQTESPRSVQLIRHPRRTKVSVPTSSPSLGSLIITLGPKPLAPSTKPEAVRRAQEERVVPVIPARRHPFPRPGSRLPCAQLRPGPAAPGPPPPLQHHPARRGRDVTAASSPPAAGTRRASLKRHRPVCPDPCRPRIRLRPLKVGGICGKAPES